MLLAHKYNGFAPLLSDFHLLSAHTFFAPIHSKIRPSVHFSKHLPFLSDVIEMAAPQRIVAVAGGVGNMGQLICFALRKHNVTVKVKSTH